jgi:glycosyltransferase involved in cell wall biosynthesis
VSGPRILNLMLAATPGGLESMARNYHAALAAQGAEVLSVGVKDSWFEASCREAGDAFAGLPAASPIDPRQAWRVRAIARRFDADVLVAHGSRGAAVAVPAASGRGTRVAVVMHNMRARPVAARADLVIGVSRAVTDDLKARFPEARVALVENFASLERAAVRTAFNETPLIGGLGRLHAEKGFDILLEAAAILRARGRPFRIAIAGDGPATADLRALVERRGLNDIAAFLGWLAPPQAFLRTLDLFVLPSRTEAFGLAVVEAMAAGAPVVATDIEGPRALLDGGRYGRLVAPESPEALADAIAGALDAPAATFAAAQRAQNELVPRYDMAAGGQRLLAALQPLIG